MDPLTAFRRAEGAFVSVLAKVGPDQAGAPTPCTEWSVRDVVAHVVAGNWWLAGGQSPRVPDDIEGLIGAYAASAEATYSVLAAPRGLEWLYEFPFGSVPGAVAARMRARDALVHGWDLAKATGQSTDLDPDLAADLLEFSRQQITAEFRGPGRRFAAEQPCDPGRPAADRLAAFLGRAVDDGAPTGRWPECPGDSSGLSISSACRFTIGRAARPHVVLRNGQERKSGMTEQSGQPSGVHENSAIFALDASAGDARDQAGQSTCRKGRVEEDALGAGGQLIASRAAGVIAA